MYLFEIFNFLFENRIDFLKTNAKQKLQPILDNDTQVNTKDTDEFIDHLSTFDPSKKKLYTQWLLKQYMTKKLKFEDLYKTKEDLTTFDKFKNKLPNKDINKYDPATLYDATKDINQEEPTSKRQEKQQIKTEGAEVIAKGPDATLLKLKTEEAACYYGKGTRWCTAATGSSNMFDYYNKQAPIYVLLGNDGRKFQIHFESEQYMDEEDNEVNFAELMKKYPTLGQIKYEKMDSPEGAYYFAHNALKGRFKEGEPAIMKDPVSAYEYARDVIKGRFPEAEPAIMKDPEATLEYARNIIKGRFPEAEPTIMKDPVSAYEYASDVIKGRFPEAEPYIAKDPRIREAYNKMFGTDL